MRRPEERRRQPDRGISTVEVVLLTPLLMVMVLVIVSLGVLVNANGNVNAAARDAARAGSLQQNRSGADSQAVAAAKADLGGRCTGDPVVSSGYVPVSATDPVAYYSVTIACNLDMTPFGMPGTKTIRASFTVPIDPLQNSHLEG
jgi:Flp pilus assembly protein TadG